MYYNLKKDKLFFGLFKPNKKINRYKQGTRIEMKKKQKALLHALLNHNGELTSTLLAKELGVTSRTIISYVSEINALSNKPVIVSSPTGYRVISENALLLLNEKQNHPQSYIERAYYIIRTVLIGHQSPNLFDLCESLYISYSTLKAEIRKYNVTFEKFGISFSSKNNILIIEGEESSKRKLASHVLYQETNKNFIDLDLLKELFGQDMVNKVMNFISDVCNEHQFYINDYSSALLLQHLLITFKRIKDEEYINTDSISITDPHELEIINSLSASLKRVFNLKLTVSEQIEIYMMFKARINYPHIYNMNNYEQLAGNEIIKITRELVDDIKSTYLVDLTDENFVASFSVHLKTFFDRMSLGQFNKNPMLGVVKHDCPLIYDIAVYMAFQLQRKYNIPLIAEDEIAYFALHIGCEMDRQKSDPLKIKCVLLCPEYLELCNSILNHIMFYHGNEISIIKIISQPHEIKNLDFSLLITTVDIPQCSDYETYYISPFLSEENIPGLDEKIHKVKEKQKKLAFKNNFEDFFDKELFMLNPPVKNKHAAIQILSDLLEEHGYVQPDFWKQVLEREEMSSTSFNSLALPHSIKLDSIKTCVGVIVSESGIDWDGNSVNIILLPAITDFEKNYLSDIYSVLLPLFSDKNLPQMIKHLSSYEDFKSYILNNI